MISFSGITQNLMQVGGNVQDTTAKKPLQNAVAMAVRLSDSLLVKYGRTNENGIFLLKDIPIDTYQVIISYPHLADRFFIITGSKENTVFDFGRIILSPNTQQLNEVVIYAFKDPIYYRGDTLVYTADSFKVKPNATVEDLLKKLPGVKVDAQGKITTQGKTVDKVLVDGDEFFGSDPTVATRNLTATSIESVQVYDKKTDPSSSSTSDNETIKVMNLKLKDDARKGYFGKLSAAGGAADATKNAPLFYEGDLLANKFNNKRKFSIFALAGNTPKTSFGWGDIFKYGLSNDMNMATSDDGLSFSMNNSSSNGIPQTLKTGAYFTDKIGKKTKLLFNYTLNQSQLTTSSTTRQQYFLEDTTYTTTNESVTRQQGQSHTFNFDITQDLDSLTTLELKPKVTVGTSSNYHLEKNEFITQDDTVTRQTVISNNSRGSSYDIDAEARLKRKFRKADRILSVSYDFSTSNAQGIGILKTTNTYFKPISFPISDVDQQKTNNTQNLGHNATFSYIEPLSKKIKIELMGDFTTNTGTQDKKTLNFSNGDYTLKDSLLSNNFRNTRSTYRAGFKFIYDVKKQRFAVGTRVREVLVDNLNQVTQVNIKQDVKNILPFLTWRYKFSDNKEYSFNYFTGSSLPSINQLQPVPNNANPNYITLGNPGLLPTYEHHFEMNYSSFKPISGNSLWAGINSLVKENDFSSATNYDNIGRTITQPINVQGNYSTNGWFGMGIPMFSKVINISPNISADYYSNTNYINNKKNITTNASANGDLEISVQTEKINFSISGNYDYNYPLSTLNAQSNKPYAMQEYQADFSWQLPLKFNIATDASYVINTKRTAGYNISYIIWNASIGKAFLKNENLILSIKGNDILNQNISASRTVNANVITDNKTNIIKRYIMLQLLWKFNSQKKKEESDWD
ncbi:MAG: outer membrane beta-barrel protein [Bacteroidia bacterium]